MKEFFRKHKFDIIYWSIVSPIMLVFMGLLVWYGILKPSLEADRNLPKPIVTLVHVDKNGTMWVEIDGELYYLYLSDNGTQKTLIFK